MSQPALVERQHELGMLDALLADAVDGKGGAVVVSGPPGIGKSALLAWADREAGDRGFQVLRARCHEREADRPFGVVRKLWDPCVREWPSLLEAGAAANAGPIFGLGRGETGAFDRRHTLHHALYWLTCGLAEAGPVAVVLDDLQWIDTESARYLEHLIRGIEGLPVALACATRDPAAGISTMWGDAAPDRWVQLVQPEPLTVDGAGLLLGALCSEGVSTDFVRACHSASGGNPFLLHELLACMRIEGVPTDDRGALTVPQLSPDGVARTVMRRLATLPEAARRVAHAVVILGDNADPQRLAELADVDHAALERALRALAGHEIVRRGDPPGVVHPVIAETLYASLAGAERTALHLRAARILQSKRVSPGAVAEHLQLCEPVGEQWVVEVLRAAAQEAHGGGAPESGVRMLRRALAEDVQFERDELLFELGELEWLSGDPEAAGHLHASSDPRAALLLLRLHIANVDLESAVAVWDRARNHTTDPVLLRRMRAELSSLMPYEQSPRLFTPEQLEEFTHAPGTTPDEILLLCNAAMWHGLAGRRSQAVQLADRACRAPAFLAGEGGNQLAQTIAASVFIWSDDHDRAGAVIQQMLTNAATRGSMHSFTYATGLQSVLGYYGGDMRLCASAAQAGMSAVHSLPLFHPVLGGSAALAAIEGGQYGAAEEVLAPIVLSEPAPTAHARFARARLAQIRGHLDEAVEEFTTLGAQVASGNRVPWPAWQIGCAEVLVTRGARGDRDRATELVVGYRDLAETWGTPSAVAMALRGEALLAAGPDRLELLEATAEAFATTVARLEHARALVHLGLQLRLERFEKDARSVLTEALDIAGLCGATALQLRAADELVAAGGRPRRLRTTGSDALTPSERRVAELATKGLTNTEIAQALFITRSTVEKHIASTLRKLGASSRTEIAAQLNP